MITSQNNRSHPSPFMAELQGIRYFAANEPKDKATINVSFSKNLNAIQ
jgi:hypothetical protein